MLYPDSIPALALCLLAVSIGGHFLLRNKKPGFPIINDYPGDFFRTKASQDYLLNAKSLLAEGYQKYLQKPFAILVPHGVKVILPPSLTDWVKFNKDLDHQQLVRDEYGAAYPGFEAQLVLHHPNRFVINIIQAKLAKNDQTLPVLDVHIKAALSDLWGEEDSWHPLDWENGTTGLISRAAASIFVGPELANNEAWQKVSRSYVQNFFHGGLRTELLASLVEALPRSMVNAVVSERNEKAKVAEAEGKRTPEFNDVLAWTMNAKGGNPFEPGDVQLALAMAAFFTTAEVLRQVIIDVARSPGLIDALRHEIESVISSHGITAAGLFQMELLDSTMKESQRLMPALVGFERLVVRDTALPDGTIIQQGTHIGVDAREMWSQEVYGNPEEYDAWRFVKRRQAGVPASQFVQSGREHNSFGVGKHQCPGRFFAANELKLCLVHVLRHYDIRMEDGYSAKPLQFGFMPIADPSARIEIRRR
ncbi:hypothetical protein Q7P37_006987 [Cladosporium fusiforme]